MLFPTIYFLRRSETSGERRRGSVVPATIGWRRSASSADGNDPICFGGYLVSRHFSGCSRFFLLIGFLKAIFLQMDYVFPKFGDRELGLHAPVGKLAGINAFIIIFLAPVVGALTQKFSAYRMVIIGGAICAAGVFIMALPTDWFEAAANSGIGQWLGHSYLGLKGSIHPYYIMTALYLTMFSVGEAFYSPRVYEYAAAIAPKGQEASYGALAYHSISHRQTSRRHERLDSRGLLSGRTARDAPGRCGSSLPSRHRSRRSG